MDFVINIDNQYNEEFNLDGLIIIEKNSVENLINENYKLKKEIQYIKNELSSYKNILKNIIKNFFINCCNCF